MSLRRALQELGYVEQRNVVYLGRWADAKQDRLPGLAVELIGFKVDVIVTVGGPASGAAKQATSSIPIVMAAPRGGGRLRMTDPRNGGRGIASSGVSLQPPRRCNES